MAEAMTALAAVRLSDLGFGEVEGMRGAVGLSLGGVAIGQVELGCRYELKQWRWGGGGERLQVSHLNGG